MAVSFHWEITGATSTPSPAGVASYIIRNVSWIYRGRDNQFSAAIGGNTNLKEPEDVMSFIPFEDVKQEVVVEWIEKSIGSDTVDAMKKEISAIIDRQKNPFTRRIPPKINRGTE